MRLSNQTRGKLGVYILLTAISYNMAIFSLGPPLKRLIQTGSIFSLIGRDDITLFEKRYERLRQIIPPYGIVGYLPVNMQDYDSTDIEQYFLVKYTLSPVLVGQGDNYEYVIGNFYRKNIDPQDIVSQMSKNGFQVTTKIDDRLILFRKKQ